MNKKYIQIGIIIIAFGASGLILYKGMGGSNSNQPAPALVLPPAPTTPSTGSSGTVAVKTVAPPTRPGDILPYGTTLDLENILRKQNFRFGSFEYPVVDFVKEVGSALGNLVKPVVLETEEIPAPVKKP